MPELQQRHPRAFGSLFLFVTFLLASQSAYAAGPKLVIVADEWVDGRWQGDRKLSSALASAIAGRGFTHSKGLARVLAERGFDSAKLLQKPPAFLRKLKLDLLIVARLVTSTGFDKKGLRYKARLQVRVIETVHLRALASFDGKHSGLAKNRKEARNTALRGLLQRSWKNIKGPLTALASGKGEIALFVDHRQLSMPAERLVSLIASLPEIADARILSSQQDRTMISLRAGPKAAPAFLPRMLDQRLGLTFDNTRRLAWWATAKAPAHALAVRIVLRCQSKNRLRKAAAEVAPLMLKIALSNSPSIKTSQDKTAKPLTLTVGRRQLSLSVAGIQLSAPLLDPAHMTQAIWQLATKLDATWLEKKKVAIGKLGQLRDGQLQKLDILGVLPSGQLLGLAGPARLRLSKAAKEASIDLPSAGYKASGLEGAKLVLPKEVSRLSAHTAPMVGVMKVNFAFGAKQQRRLDALRIPVVLWPANVIDNKRPATLGALVDPRANQVRRLLASGYAAASAADEMRKVERAIWIPLLAHSLVNALQLEKLTPPRSKGRLAMRQLPEQTIEKRAGSQADLTLLFASLVHAAGGQTQLFTVRGGLLVAVSLGWLPNAAGLAYAEKSRLMTLGKTLWLPLWLDGKSGFEKSWSAGFRRMRKLRRAKPLLVRALDKEQGGGAKPLVDDALQSRVRKICDDVSGRIVKRLAQQGAKLIKDAKLDKAPLSTRLKVAKKLLRLRLVARAIPLLEGYLVVNEKDRTAHLLLGVSYAYQGAFALARRHFAKAKSRQARINDALMQALIGQRKTALIALRRLGARKEALALIHAARGSDPQADALARIAGATNLRTRERLLGHRTVKRRVVRRGLDLLKF